MQNARNISFSPFSTTLWPDSAPGEPSAPRITVYRASPEKATGAAVVICPGGGYTFLATEPEGHQVAQWLNTIGVAGVVLEYRLGLHPLPMQDGERAIKFVRFHAEAWGLDANRIGLLGFSAGGHVASMVGTHCHEHRFPSVDSIDAASNRPSFLMLIYPVISFYRGWRPEKPAFLGENPTTELLDYCANDRHVSPSTPPTFLAHAVDDVGVPPENSQAFYDACLANNVPAQLHLYPRGGHGFFVTTAYDCTISMWADDGLQWMRTRGIV